MLAASLACLRLQIMFGVGLAASAFTGDLKSAAGAYAGPSSNSSLARLVPCADAAAVGTCCSGGHLLWLFIVMLAIPSVPHLQGSPLLCLQRASSNLCWPLCNFCCQHLLQGSGAISSGVLLVEDLVLQINDVLNKTNSVSVHAVSPHSQAAHAAD